MRNLLLFFSLTSLVFAKAQNYYLYIGTYTSTDSKGIYIYKFNSDNGKLTWLANTDSGVVNPSFLAVTDNGKFIYACTDTKSEKEGSVSSFSFDNKTEKITFINKQPSGGANPVYITLHKSNKWLVNANYTGSNISVFGINRDGSIKSFSQEIKLTGNSVVKERQEKSHPHSVVFSTDFKYLCVPDLGSDKIITYQFNEKKAEQLVLNQSKNVVPGSGPRHFTFHPNQKFAYCIEELSGTVQVFSFKDGKLDSLQRILNHLVETPGPYSGSDIHISPDGNFLYAANRGKENNIAIYSIDNSGNLKSLGYQSTLGEIPRNFTIDPSGKYLLVANQLSGSIIVFKRDMKTGLLLATGEQINVPLPSCLKMIEIK